MPKGVRLLKPPTASATSSGIFSVHGTLLRPIVGEGAHACSVKGEGEREVYELLRKFS